MVRKRKTGKRSLKANALYFCPICFYYYGAKIGRSMWNQSPSVQPSRRTCNDCKKRGHNPK